MASLFQAPNPASIRLNDQADALFNDYGIIFDTNEGEWVQDQSTFDTASQLWTANYTSTGAMKHIFNRHRPVPPEG